MKVQIIHANGGPEVIQSGDIDTPSLGAGQVLVKVAASSVNSADLLARTLGPVVDFIPTPPAVLGMDFAGTIEALGDDVEGYQVGDDVYGCAGGVAHHQGTLAEYLAADIRLIAHKPKNLSMVEAAALPLVSITAFEALFDRMGLKAGQKILVHGGAGGVGHVAIQMALNAGATVFATDSTPARLSVLESLGATPIDYATEDVADYVERYTDGVGFDLIFDTVGGANISTALAAIKLNGQVATTVSLGEIDLTMAHLRGATIHVIYMLIPLIHNLGNERHGEILTQLTELVESDKLKPIVDSVFPFDQAAAAHQKLESKKAIGKVVVQVTT